MTAVTPTALGTAGERVTLERRTTGPVAVKIARGPGEADRLRHEAAVLERLDGAEGHTPRLVSLEDDGPVPVLVMEVAGTRSLDVGPPRAVGPLVDLLRSLCQTVAHLHARGVAHGRIDPSHVLVGPEGGAALCGLAEATVDPSEAAMADDVAAVGRLIQALLPTHLGLEGPPPRRRPGGGGPRSGTVARGLLNLADQATLEDHRRRPAAASLAAAVDDLCSGRATRPGRRRLLAAAAAVASLVATLGALSMTSGDGPPARVAEPNRPSSPASPPPLVLVGRSPTEQVEHRGTAYTATADGDRLLVGRFACGPPQVVAFREDEGTLWRFPELPDPGRVVQAIPVRGATGIRDVAVTTTARGCDLLRVRRIDGTVTTLDPAPGAS